MKEQLEELIKNLQEEAKTIKGKGVSFMENNPSWHGKSLNDEEYKKAIEELNNI